MKSGFSPDSSKILYPNKCFWIVKSLWIKMQRIAGSFLWIQGSSAFKLTLSNTLLFLNKLEEYTKSITD
jgi:hypothetical protein